MKLENVLCQIHSDHHVLHLAVFPFCGLRHISLAHAMPLGEDGNHPILFRPRVGRLTFFVIAIAFAHDYMIAGKHVVLLAEQIRMSAGSLKMDAGGVNLID